jgi:8-oxo-dGTP pyrophosphatase MutT (NUDIX family)
MRTTEQLTGDASPLLLRNGLLKFLERYTPQSVPDEATLREFRRLLLQSPAAFDRQSPTAHITGSALILSTVRDAVLLVHHAKLDKWLPPGGHVELGIDGSMLETAFREAREETGLLLSPLSSEVFDLDIHPIPARPEQPAHHHYDVAFLFEADEWVTPRVSDESRDVRWFPIREALQVSGETNMRRMIEKLVRGGFVAPLADLSLTA